MPVTKVRSTFRGTSGNLRFYESVTGNGAQIHFGVSGDGLDVKFFGDTSGAYMLWDESADALVFDKADIKMGDGDLVVFGDGSDITFNFDGTNFEVEGAAASTSFLIGADSKLLNVTLKGTLTVGKDDTGHDVKFFGATSGAYMLWDESADELVFSTGASIDLTADKVMIDFKDGDASTIDPSATAETGWINVNVDGTKRYIPYYAAS